jgi:hypothetical protein
VQETACLHILNYHQEMGHFVGTAFARSTAWAYDRSLARVVVSNPAGGMDSCPFLMLFAAR